MVWCHELLHKSSKITVRVKSVWSKVYHVSSVSLQGIELKATITPLDDQTGYEHVENVGKHDPCNLERYEPNVWEPLGRLPWVFVP